MGLDLGKKVAIELGLSLCLAGPLKMGAYEVHSPNCFTLGWDSGKGGLKNRTNGSEHALVHGDVAELESHWPWEGR